MKLNQKGFTLLEVALILVIVGALCGVGGYVISQNKQKDTSSDNSSHENKTENTSETVKKSEPIELVQYKDGVRITQKNEVAKLTDASDTFKAYIASLVPEKVVANDACETPHTVIIRQIYKDEFANGEINDCGGAVSIWKKENGTWAMIWGGQQAINCADVQKHKIPHQITEKCFDESAPDPDKLLSNPN